MQAANEPRLPSVNLSLEGGVSARARPWSICQLGSEPML